METPLSKKTTPVPALYQKLTELQSYDCVYTLTHNHSQANRWRLCIPDYTPDTPP